MALTVYGLKRSAMRPLIWLRRRQAGPQVGQTKTLMELHGYSPAIKDLLINKALDPDHLVRVAIDESSVTVDVGAYLGDVAADVRRLYGGKVYAFEPNPGVYPRLEERFADDPDVVTLPYGLGAADARLPLALAGPGSSVLGRTNRDDVTAAVQIRDVIAVLDELGIERIDLLKVNIEGAEYDLLDRLIDAGAHTRVRYMAIQFHEWHKGAHRRRAKIRRALQETHELVWDYPWIWELWCNTSEPHPRPFDFSPEERRQIVDEILLARGLSRDGGSGRDRAGRTS